MVASDIGIDEQYLDECNLTTQDSLDRIAELTIENKIKVNEGRDLIQFSIDLRQKWPQS